MRPCLSMVDLGQNTYQLSDQNVKVLGESVNPRKVIINVALTPYEFKINTSLFIEGYVVQLFLCFKWFETYKTTRLQNEYK